MVKGVGKFESVPRKVAREFDRCVAEARKSSVHARTQYPLLLAHYQSILASDASVSSKNAAYQMTKEVHALAGKSPQSSFSLSNRRLYASIISIIL
ncbi:MAG: hypothetical protein AABY01_04875, partial [Nanoarchaeota archaeon]